MKVAKSPWGEELHQLIGGGGSKTKNRWGGEKMERKTKKVAREKRGPIYLPKHFTQEGGKQKDKGGLLQ